MADPQGYERDYSFSDYQSNNPSQPLPGPRVDNELENIEQAISGLVGAVKDVRRSDGALKNEIVTMDSLHPVVKAGVGQGAVETLEQAHEAAQAAAQSASAAASSAGAAAGSAGTAATSAGQAMGFRNAAQNARDDAITAKNGADTARDYAAQWASAPEGQIVDDGLNPPEHSAYHYAQVALGAATGALPEGSVTTSKIADEAVTEGKLAPAVAGKLNSSDKTTAATVGAAVASTSTDVPDDSDSFVGLKAGSSTLFRLTWADLKSLLKTYFDTIFAPLDRTISASGLASGGGTLAANRTITVPKSTKAQAEAGTDDTTAMTPLRVADAVAAMSPVGLYTGSSNSVTSLPLGHIIGVRILSGTAPSRNAVVAPCLGGSAWEYIPSGQTGAGAALSGTWRSRGPTGFESPSTYVMVQRTA